MRAMLIRMNTRTLDSIALQATEYSDFVVRRSVSLLPGYCCIRLCCRRWKKNGFDRPHLIYWRCPEHSRMHQRSFEDRELDYYQFLTLCWKGAGWRSHSVGFVFELGNLRDCAQYSLGRLCRWKYLSQCSELKKKFEKIN